MDYSAFNPLVWCVFLGFGLLTWLAERAYRARNPDYPGRTPDGNE